MRYVGLDLGDKRTGIAAGDAITRLASPVSVLEVPVANEGGESLLRALAQAIREHLGDPPSRGEVVVGLPLNMDGTEGPAATKARQFAERLATVTGRVVHLHDERLTSADADWAMSQSGLTRDQKKRRRDALAAAAMLRDFLGTLGPPAADH